MGPYEIWALWNMGLSAKKYILHVNCVYMTKWEIESRHNNLWNTRLFSYIHACFAWRLYSSKGSLCQIEFVIWKETILWKHHNTFYVAFRIVYSKDFAMVTRLVGSKVPTNPITITRIFHRWPMEQI